MRHENFFFRYPVAPSLSLEPHSLPCSLPRPCLHLYEWAMAEEEFVANAKELNNLLNHPEVEGVYEMSVPLQFKLIMEVP